MIDLVFRQRVAGAVAALLLLAAGVRHGVAQGPAQTRNAPATLVVATERFVFHSDPWINLHHFLYQWAGEDKGLGTGRQQVPVPIRQSQGWLHGGAPHRHLLHGCR